MNTEAQKRLLALSERLNKLRDCSADVAGMLIDGIRAELDSIQDNLADETAGIASANTQAIAVVLNSFPFTNKKN